MVAVTNSMKLASTLAFFLLALPATATTPKPVGKMVDLGGHDLHFVCTGKGSPTVVVEYGLGDSTPGWTLVQSRVQKFTRVCTYDRAGYAWSGPGPKPRTFAQINLELHDALAKLGERGPFILVGHSYGGAVVRNYALTYPTEVAGMVLVDSIHEDQRIEIQGKAVRLRESAKGKQVPAPRENMLPLDKPDPPPLPAGLPTTVEPPFDRLPAKEQQLFLWASFLPVTQDAENSQREWSVEYFALWHAKSQAGSLGNIPLIVLTRADGGYGNDLDVPAAELEAERKRLASELSKLSTNGKLITVNSGHNMQVEAPDAVADAVRSVVEEVRKKK